jgi:ribosomal protein S18 acetylase RimI-like enzyme
MTAPARVSIHRLDDAAARDAVPALAAVLRDCVESGASVSFLAPLSREKSEAFWERVAVAVSRGETALLVARDGDGICGTVQLQMALPENQPHRGEIAKLLVLRSARRKGVAEALMRGIEAVAVAEGKSLLTLDTASATAERLYRRLGWTRCGVIPDYALNPNRTFCDTVIYWKRVS